MFIIKACEKINFNVKKKTLNWLLFWLKLKNVKRSINDANNE